MDKDIVLKDLMETEQCERRLKFKEAPPKWAFLAIRIAQKQLALAIAAENNPTLASFGGVYNQWTVPASAEASTATSSTRTGSRCKLYDTNPVRLDGDSVSRECVISMAKRHTLSIYDYMTSQTSLRLRQDNLWKLLKTMAKCGLSRTPRG
ncbi:hypothetical protein Y032_0022g569 [Ancylostoma ceylanicum]|uniref:Uncharacterized protein n=1 Tax=Ancylostoma ceylanicum TaxID=53326 RepID=A0A016UY14_9BILA|nr:hypothetical protein Y032_0022g569 [Ancylostoma ceylanicum]